MHNEFDRALAPAEMKAIWQTTQERDALCRRRAHSCGTGAISACDAEAFHPRTAGVAVHGTAATKVAIAAWKQQAQGSPYACDFS
jgi:hypothetical protein